ncbi:AAA family ATPase [Gordonia terrae]|uniref:ATP-binding protein n=1 Tax=Gordonia hongkongensis TaxID=1701090 RepID=UPI0022B46B71|nr:AAA family ATPase [Gordonia terrae]
MLASQSADRRAVVDEMHHFVAAAQRDSGSARRGVGVITAGPGAGKTHTLRELASATDGSVRTVRADELSWRQPFGLAGQLLGVDLPTPVPDGFDDDLYARVDTLCADGPLVLVVDDAHHADAATLELLSRLVPATRVLPLVMLLGRRPLPERDLLNRLVARAEVVDWSLPPLGADEVHRISIETVGAAPDAELFGLLGASGGNPMHVISVLRALQQSGGLRIVDGHAAVDARTASGVPSGLEDAIAEHVALLDGRARELTQKLAVWGRPATLAQLAAVDAVPPASLVGPAQSAIDAGIVGVDDGGALRFTHDLYADVTYGQLDPMLRSVLHDAIASHPSTRHDPQSVAHHESLRAVTNPRCSRRYAVPRANSPARRRSRRNSWRRWPAPPVRRRGSTPHSRSPSPEPGSSTGLHASPRTAWHWRPRSPSSPSCIGSCCSP